METTWSALRLWAWLHRRRLEGDGGRHRGPGATRL